jgi:hypothetical protein
MGGIPCRLADNEETVEHAQVRFGLCAGKDQDYLVEIGDKDL